jgi:hypothetical protein
MTTSRVIASEAKQSRFGCSYDVYSIDPAHADVFDFEEFLDAVFLARVGRQMGPMRLSFMPPNGAISPAGFRRDDALVDADDAVFERFGDAPDAADVAAVEIEATPLPNPPPRAGEGRVGVSLAILTASASVLKR